MIAPAGHQRLSTSTSNTTPDYAEKFRERAQWAPECRFEVRSMTRTDPHNGRRGRRGRCGVSFADAYASSAIAIKSSREILPTSSG